MPDDLPPAQAAPAAQAPINQPPQRNLVTIREITKVVRLQGRHKAYDVVTVSNGGDNGDKNNNGGANDGWQVVVYRNDFAPGDLVVYFEIDSFIPAAGGRIRFAWEHGNKMTTFRDEKGYHVRSQMLGRHISQGLVQNIGAVPAVKDFLLRQPDSKTGFKLHQQQDHNYQAHRGHLSAAEQQEQNEADRLDAACRWAAQSQIRLDDVVGVTKWEIPFESHGKVLSRVPTFFPRPACDRVQNMPALFSPRCKYRDTVFQVTEKLDGVSMTVYRVVAGSKWHRGLPALPATTATTEATQEKDQEEFRIGVASAGQDLDERGNDVYWQAAKHSAMGLLPTKIHAISTALKLPNVAVQGELVGPSIKNNSLRFASDAPHEFIVFQMFDIDQQRYVDPARVLAVCGQLRVPHVPLLGYFHLRDFASSMRDILAKAEGTATGSQGQVTREGFVFKSMRDEFGFKVISNKWLLEQGE